MRRQRVDDQLDVLVQLDAEPFGPAVDVVPADLCCEALVLELLLDARRGERPDAVGPAEDRGQEGEPKPATSRATGRPAGRRK
jgi:hypothetical protein